jgi:hypothetical protein
VGNFHLISYCRAFQNVVDPHERSAFTKWKSTENYRAKAWESLWHAYIQEENKTKLKLSHYTSRKRLGWRGVIAPTDSLPRHKMGGSGQRHAPASLYPGERAPSTHCTGGWVGPRAGLDTEDRGKILSPLPGIEPRSTGHPASSQTLFWLSYPAHLNNKGNTSFFNRSCPFLWFGNKSLSSLCFITAFFPYFKLFFVMQNNDFKAFTP